MSKKLKLIWIDDDPKRSKESENLESRLNVNVDFINLKNKNVTSELNQLIFTTEMPDLILMDHKLYNAEANGVKTGSTAAELIREKWQNCPIVCITAVPFSDDSFDFHKRSRYEDIIVFSNLSNYDSKIISIAESFKILRENRPQNIDNLIELLNVPIDDRKRLKDILPEYLKKKENYEDKSLLMTISKWVRHTLMEKPGFLYDRLWTATLLGIKEDSFNKVENYFIGAKYDGIFADENNERWWQTKLREILFSKFPDSDTIFPWILGRELPEIEKDDFSKCYASGEDLPETVAYIDETSIKRAPMRIRYTVPHPDFEKSLYFEEIRMMKAAE